MAPRETFAFVLTFVRAATRVFGKPMANLSNGVAPRYADGEIASAAGIFIVRVVGKQ